MTVYLEEVETSWLLISLHDKENFTIKRTGVCDWTTAKTSSQNSRKTVVLQLESSWVVEKLMFFRSLYENEISCCFNSIWECCIKLKQALKKVKYLECFFFYSLWRAQSYGMRIILQKRRRGTFGARLLDLKLRKTVLQNYFQTNFRVKGIF